MVRDRVGDAERDREGEGDAGSAASASETGRARTPRAGRRHEEERETGRRCRFVCSGELPMRELPFLRERRGRLTEEADARECRLNFVLFRLDSRRLARDTYLGPPMLPNLEKPVCHANTRRVPKQACVESRRRRREASGVGHVTRPRWVPSPVALLPAPAPLPC